MSSLLWLPDKSCDVPRCYICLPVSIYPRESCVRFKVLELGETLSVPLDLDLLLSHSEQKLSQFRFSDARHGIEIVSFSPWGGKALTLNGLAFLFLSPLDF